MTCRATRTEGTVVKDETFTVTTPALVCSKGQHIAFDGKDVQEQIARTKHGLLTAEEIREARKRLAISQRQFAEVPQSWRGQHQALRGGSDTGRVT